MTCAEMIQAKDTLWLGAQTMSLLVLIKRDIRNLASGRLWCFYPDKKSILYQYFLCKKLCRAHHNIDLMFQLLMSVHKMATSHQVARPLVCLLLNLKKNVICLKSPSYTFGGYVCLCRNHICKDRPTYSCVPVQKLGGEPTKSQVYEVLSPKECTGRSFGVANVHRER